MCVCFRSTKKDKSKYYVVENSSSGSALSPPARLMACDRERERERGMSTSMIHCNTSYPVPERDDKP